MNYLDAVLAVPLIWGLYKGATRGIVKELFSLLALILGIYGSVHFADLPAPYLKEYLNIDSSFFSLASFSLTFIFIVILIRILGLVIDKVIKMAALGLVSRFFGAIFGALKATFILSVLLFIVNTVDYYLDLIPIQQKKESVLYEPISAMLTSIIYRETDESFLFEDAQKVMKEAKEIIPL